MFIERATIDDLLRDSISHILKYPGEKITSKKGVNHEITGAYLKLSNPLARLSSSLHKGKIFSSLGELLWYLSGSNKLDFIKYYIDKYDEYSDDNHTLYGSYGSRIYGSGKNKLNQFENLIKILSTKRKTRQAIIQILEPADLFTATNDLPCTISLQFLVRDNKLHMFTNMRSNDIFKGFAHDVFSFTMLQEIVARILDLELGSYNHFVSSFHLYEKDMKKATAYLNEGYQSTKHHMPTMPCQGVRESIKTLLNAENCIRTNSTCEFESLNLDKYWSDLIKLLQAYSIYKNRSENEIAINEEKLQKINDQLTFSFFSKYVVEKLLSLQHE